MACGIVAVVASRKGALRKPLGEVIRESLKSLEYRGYDSVGFAIITDNGLVVRKSKGMIDSVTAKLGFSEFDGLVGIGHTRWATHGPPSDRNSHPHTDCTGKIAVAHNGIIENWNELKEMLVRKGHVFKSDTDTEVIPHLMEEFKNKGMEPYEAFKATISLLKGAYAIAAIDIDAGNKVFFARKTSPLIVGIGDGANFLASDIPAFLRYTRKIIVVSDDEVGYVTSSSVFIEKLIKKGDKGIWISIDIGKRLRTVEWTPEMAMKGGYPHFMLKEIHEQPQALASTISGLGEKLDDVVKVISAANKVVLVGAGTSYHASYLGAIFLNNLGEVFAQPIISSEMKWHIKSLSEGDVMIAVSQSGETIDTLLAAREAKDRGVKVIALSNVIDSAIPREADLVVYTRAGPEIGVAATKTFTTQVLVLSVIAVKVAKYRGIVNEGASEAHLRAIRSLPETVNKIISKYEAKSKDVAKLMASKRSAFFLGRGYGLPVSMEGALKLKEVAYVHAEAYPAGESKHGPIALVEDGFPIVFTAVSHEEAELIKSNVEEMRARYAWTIAVTPKGDEGHLKNVEERFTMPELPVTAASVAYVVPHQLIAYYTSIIRGYDPDKPRNLAKTVTVV